MAYNYIIKLVIVGDCVVGKTSLLSKYIDNDFSDAFVSTVGIDFRTRIIQVDGKRVKLQIWDTAGQERFKALTRAYYRGMHGALLVYDVSNESSFLNVKDGIDDVIKNYVPGNGNNDQLINSLDMILIGNKSDLDTNRQISYERGEELAREYGMKFFETSAKNSHNVEKIFEIITRDIKQIFDSELLKDNLCTPSTLLIPPSESKTSREYSNCTYC